VREGNSKMRAHTSPWSFRRVLVLVAAVNLLLGVALFALRSPQGAGAALEPPPALPPQVEALRALIAEGRHGEPYVLDLTDDELSATAEYFLAQRPNVPFARVRMAVQGPLPGAEGLVVVDAVTRGLAFTVPVRASGRLSAAAGLPRATIEDVSLGGTPLPAFVRDRVLAEADASLDFSRYALPVTVDALELRPGGLTIRGTVGVKGGRP